MKITTIRISNIRGFKKLEWIKLSKTINIFIGANNSGKSTILNSIHLLQKNGVLTKSDYTVGEEKAEIDLGYEGSHESIIPNTFSSINLIPHGNKRTLTQGGHKKTMPLISEEEPHNLIYPYLSKRKAVSFTDTINEKNTNSVLGNFTNLYSKIDRLVTPQFQPGNEEYLKACNRILGFEISTLASRNGKKAVYFVHNMEHIPLTAMGEGVTNILGLITDLCVAKDRIFLIEEPENDIHPKALKDLLNLIVEKSNTNQFFVSTHSNIVMKYLGSEENSKIFNVKSELSDPIRSKLFVSKITEVPATAEDKRSVLESLGYDFFDFGLWNSWLFLEESSAEVLIRDWIIKWFTPKLTNKLRTYSSGSTSQVIPKFEDFNKLFVFLHLEPTYKNKVWVWIDAGNDEKKIIDKLNVIYKKSGWNEENFGQFNQHDFEKYYPAVFQGKVDAILKITDKQKKRIEKLKLLEDVKSWIKKDEKHAKSEFKKSAKNVIALLKKIDKEINGH